MSLDAVLFSNPKGVCCDTRMLSLGDVYVSIQGEHFDGDEFALEALQLGASWVVTRLESDLPSHPKIVRVEDSRSALAKLAHHIYQPQPKIVVAITGTSGKTSVAYFYYQIAKLLGYQAGYIGTLGIISCADESALSSGESVLTSPDAVSLNMALRDMALQGVEYVALEASSHGLDQHRLDYINFTAAAFTNLSQDHLDYHVDMAQYFNAKKRLFSHLLGRGTAVLNHDIPQYVELLEASNRSQILDYGYEGGKLTILDYDSSHCSMVLPDGKLYEMKHKLIGNFQAHNLAAAIGLGIASGWKEMDIVKCIQHLQAAPGRLEEICMHNGARVMLDYAHKPDALQKVLSTLRDTTVGRLIVVFGCGGDRDKAKRPLMGAIAAELADVVIVTDDNPRGEDPQVIRQQILNACPGATSYDSRAVAIQKAMGLLKSGDTLLVAGKGHENYQLIGNTKFDFSDKEEILKYAH
jgi:UDP-N-acetylmuramoyl-L-alanyl-D-glutamate--2,6-diaminopimelate ligase